jgi:hypothetical protein
MSFKKSFIIKDNNENTYRLIAKDFAQAIHKVTTDHNINEDDIVSVNIGKSISSLSLG